MKNISSTKDIKVRNWHILNARFRHTAGRMRDKRKQQSREACRKWKNKRDE